VRAIANRVLHNIRSYTVLIEFDDLFNAGWLGLREAAVAFDPKRGVSFENYSECIIRGRILDELRRADKLKRVQRDRVKRISTFRRQFQQREKRFPTPAEIETALGLDPHQVAYPRFVDGDHRPKEMLNVPESAPNPEENASTRELVRLAIDALPTRQQLVMRLYYFEDRPMREIGTMIGTTESGVSQLHSRAILRCRQILQETSGPQADQCKSSTRDTTKLFPLAA